MPGTDDRQPSPADRPPASRVGQKLQEATEGVDPATTDADQIEQDAIDAAREQGWDQSQTDRERSRPGGA
jgi:hypothetical protein